MSLNCVYHRVWQTYFTYKHFPNTPVNLENSWPVEQVGRDELNSVLNTGLIKASEADCDSSRAPGLVLGIWCGLPPLTVFLSPYHTLGLLVKDVFQRKTICYVSKCWILNGSGDVTHFLYFTKIVFMHSQSHPTLGDPTDCSLPGSSVHGIFLARTLGCHFFPRGSSQPRDRTSVSCI